MNALERRRLARSQIIDLVTRTSVGGSRLQREEAAKELRKRMAKNKYGARPVESISYPQTRAS